MLDTTETVMLIVGASAIAYCMCQRPKALPRGPIHHQSASMCSAREAKTSPVDSSALSGMVEWNQPVSEGFYDQMKSAAPKKKPLASFSSLTNTSIESNYKSVLGVAVLAAGVNADQTKTKQPKSSTPKHCNDFYMTEAYAEKHN